MRLSANQMGFPVLSLPSDHRKKLDEGTATSAVDCG